MNIDYNKDDLLGEFGIRTLEDRYLLDSETSPQELFARVAKTYGDDEAHSERLYKYISNLWFMPATPILTNGGTSRGLPISCYLNTTEDSRSGIMNNFTENAFLSSLGGGIGTYWGGVRGDGAPTSNGSSSTGVIPFIKVSDSQSLAFSQGKTRRGSQAVYLDMSHPEIEEFLDIRKPTGGDANRKSLNLHNGVVITDEFMRLIEGASETPGFDDSWDLICPNSGNVVRTVSAKTLWVKLLHNRMETGEPYIVFIDTVNRALPQFLKDRGLKVHHSNLCVSGDTKVLTSRGHINIETLENTEVEVWNGQEFSSTVVHKTSEYSDLVRVALTDGSYLDCTPYHKFYTKNKYHGAPVETRAIDLKVGDKLEKLTKLPIIDGLEQWDAPYANGFYTSDGTLDRGFAVLYFYGEKEPIAHIVSEHLDTPMRVEPDNNRVIIRLPSSRLKPKFTVPLNGSVDTKIAWLAGVFDGDACLTNNGGTQSIQLTSNNKEYLLEVRLLLQTLGVNSKVALGRPAKQSLLPDGRGGKALYNTKETFRLLFGEAGVQTLLGLGLLEHANRVLPVIRKPNRDASRFAQVVSVTPIEGGPTWCFNEPKRHRGVFNGILTGQCVEITLPTAPDRTAVCCLSSLNLETYDEWKDDELFIEDVVRFLDNVLQDFIDRAPPELERARYSAERERSIGLGAMGFHSYLQSKLIPIESAVALSINNNIFKYIKGQALLASRKLAKERGEAPDAEGSGLRFSHLMAVAPNASSSIICGNTSASIEPWSSNIVNQKTMSGSHFLKNKYLEQWLSDNGYNYQEVWDSIVDHQGSVQHLGFMDEWTRDVFKTFAEIDQRWLIEHAAMRQNHICQSQSLNLSFPHNTSKSELHNVHMAAWKKGVKTLYYLRSNSATRATTVMKGVVNNDECLACEG